MGCLPRFGAGTGSFMLKIAFLKQHRFYLRKLVLIACVLEIAIFLFLFAMLERKESPITESFKVYMLNLSNFKKSKNYFSCKGFIDKTILLNRLFVL